MYLWVSPGRHLSQAPAALWPSLGSLSLSTRPGPEQVCIDSQWCSQAPCWLRAHCSTPRPAVSGKCRWVGQDSWGDGASWVWGLGSSLLAGSIVASREPDTQDVSVLPPCVQWPQLQIPPPPPAPLGGGRAGLLGSQLSPEVVPGGPRSGWNQKTPSRLSPMPGKAGHIPGGHRYNETGGSLLRAPARDTRTLAWMSPCLGRCRHLQVLPVGQCHTPGVSVLFLPRHIC